MLPEGPIISNDPPICKKYSDNLEYNNDHFFIVRQKDIEKSGFINIRLMVHELLAIIMDEGWIDPKYPKDILDTYFKKILEYNHLIHISSPYRLQLNVGPMPGREFIQHFFAMARMRYRDRITLAESWINQRLIYKTINYLLEHNKNLTRDNMIKYFSKAQNTWKRLLPQMSWPTFWIGLLKYHFPECKSAIDFEPGNGGKCIGCALNHIDYYHNDYDYEDNYISLSSYLDKKCELYKGQDADIAFLSREIPLEADIAIDRLSQYLGLAKRSIITISNEALKIVGEIYPPETVLRYTRLIAQPDDYILFY